MNRKAEIFFDAITLLREDLVEEAQNYVFRRKNHVWRRFGSLAACAVLVVSLGMVAILPRGCGASSGSGSDMSANGSSSAPAQTAPDVDAPSGDSAPSDGGDMNAAPPPPAPAEEPEAVPGDGLVRFSGHVLEILEDGLLVAPFDSLPETPALVRVPTAGLEDLPEFYLGGVVQVTCRGFILEDGAAIAEGVTALDLVEP